MSNYHDFAMLVQVEPESRLRDWEMALRAASPEPGMSVTIRKPTLIFFAVAAENEFLAIERAERWLNRLTRCLLPPCSLAFNAQPSEEIY